MTCCSAGLPAIRGADPDCFLCEGSGLDPTVSETCVHCPVCMSAVDDIIVRGLEQPLPYDDTDSDGWLDGVERVPARWVRGVYTKTVYAVVMHRLHRGYHDAGPRYVASGDRRVSWHFTVHRPTFKRAVTQHAPITRRCWHAGRANGYSIGIEHDYPGPDGYTDEQMAASADLVRSLRPLLPDLRQVIAHSHLYPRTRSDPGEGFAWDLFHEMGLEVVA